MSKIMVGTVGGIDMQIKAANKLGRHNADVFRGCGVIDTKSKIQKKEKVEFKKIMDDCCKKH